MISFREWFIRTTGGCIPRNHYYLSSASAFPPRGVEEDCNTTTGSMKLLRLEDHQQRNNHHPQAAAAAQASINGHFLTIMMMTMTSFKTQCRLDQPKRQSSIRPKKNDFSKWEIVIFLCLCCMNCRYSQAFFTTTITIIPSPPRQRQRLPFLVYRSVSPTSTSTVSRILSSSASCGSTQPQQQLLVLHNVPCPEETNHQHHHSKDVAVKLGTKLWLETSVSSRFQERFIRTVQTNVDDLSGGWALSYADLSPDSEQTIPGQAFLATNLAYAIAGIVMTFYVKDSTLGLLTELCALGSFNYHYHQLQARGQERSDTVRKALLLDYALAGTSILTGLAYLFLLLPAVVPTAALFMTGLGVAFLVASWKWEYGKPYMVLHGMWHLCSAAGGYLISEAYSAGTI